MSLSIRAGLAFSYLVKPLATLSLVTKSLTGAKFFRQ